MRAPVFAELTHRTPAPAPVQEAPRSTDALEAVREGHRIAHAIIARAEAQAQEIGAAAREQGFEAGRRQALEQMGAELRSAASALAAAAQKLDDSQSRLHAQVMAELPGAAVEIASRILRQELALKPDALVRVIRDALAAVTPTSRVELRVNPEDLAVFDQHKALLADALGSADVRLESSPDIRRGGCLIETDALTLAAGIVEQLERALELLGGGAR
ncbi:MAG: hypothetical protein DMD91_18835 [Candidatus Rokuibacteriota bacterium]|nr:MAG: hypothetical protein DMD91_18835 [Candidatus Rokubacteria bacterium]